MKMDRSDNSVTAETKKQLMEQHEEIQSMAASKLYFYIWDYKWVNLIFLQ